MSFFDVMIRCIVLIRENDSLVGSIGESEYIQAIIPFSQKCPYGISTIDPISISPSLISPQA